VGSFRDIANAPVTADQLRRVVELSTSADQLSENPSPVELLATVEFAADTLCELAIPAILFRLDALSSLICCEALPGWVARSADDGFVLIDDAVFEAAAKAPLYPLGGGNNPSFNEPEFLELTLRLAEADGHA
jgi:hypothetical protein